MTTYSADQIELSVLTFKDGLLSKIAHDLEIRVTSLSLTIDEDQVRGTFDTNSLRVQHAIKNGRPDKGELSGGDKRKIEGNIVKDVLHARRFPEASFVSDEVTKEGETVTLSGKLTLHGVTRSVRATARKTGTHWVTEIPLHQPDYSIKPYKAALGALKVKPGVRVVVRVPAE